MKSNKQGIETAMVDSMPYGSIHVKSHLENGTVERHSFTGNAMDLEGFMENIEGEVMDIQILSWEAAKQ